MRQFFSTILSQAYSRKKIILGVLAIALFFSLVPVQFAQANIFTDIASYIATLPFKLIAAVLVLVLFILALVSGFIFVLIGGVLSSFILGTLTTPVIPGQGISIVDFGWDTTRNIVNIVFILILVFIGLATILRLQTYQLQKTLPTLIIMALLVNFSGIFVGFIVDMSNLVIGVFISQFAGFSVDNLKAFVWDGPTNYLATSFKTLFADIGGGFLGSVGNIAGPIVYGVVLLLFNTLGAIILFAVFLLFLVRVIILWILAILAPLAFGAYILPATKRFWSQWLQQLIQWSILGIPLGLFLVLAKQVFDNPIASIIPDLAVTPGLDPGSIVGTLNSFITQAFSPLVGLALMFLGVTLSMQMAPAGASGVINWAKKSGMQTAAWAGREGWRKIGKKTEAGAGAVRKRGQDIAANAEARLKTENLGFGQRMGLRLSRWGGKALSAASSGVEVSSQKGNLVVSKRDQETITKAEKGTTQELFDRIDTERSTAAAKGGLLEDTSKELGAFTGIIKNGDTDDIYDRIKDGRMSWDFVRKMYKNAKDNGNKDQRRLIEKAFLSRTFDQKDAQGNIIPNELGVSAEDREKIFEKIEGADFKGVIGKESLDVTTESGKMAMDEIIKHRGADLMPQFLRNANKEQRQAASQYLNSKGVQWYIDNGAEDVLKYSISPAAASLGISPIGNITQTQLTALVATKKSTEQIKREMGTIDVQLEEIEKLGGNLPKQLNDQKKNLTKRKNQIEAQLALRAGFGPEDAKDDNAQIQAKRNEYNTTVQDLQALETTTPAASRNEAYYRQEATLVKKRDEIASEFKRRGLKMEGTAATPPGEQLLSVQIARLKEQEEQLKQTAGTQKRIPMVGIGIPGTGEAGVSYLPGEKARAELKKVQAQRTKLEQQLAQKEGDMQAIENLISGADSGIKQEQEAIGVIQNGINNLMREEQNGETILQRSREEQAKDPTIIPQALIEQQEKSLRETKSHRASLEEALQEHQAKLNTHQGRKETLTAGWQILSKLEQPVKDIGTLLTENFTKAEQVEQEAQKKLSVLITQKVGPTQITEAQTVLQKARATREGWGADLGRFQRLQELKQELATAQGIQDQRKKNLESLEKGMESIEQEADRLTAQRDQTNTTLTTLENSLESESKNIAERILSENPGVGASSREFQKTLREKLAQSETIQQQITKIDEAQKQQQDQLRAMKERAAYRVLRDNPNLGMGSRAFQQEAEQRINQDPEVQQRTALLQRAEERLAEARKQLEALPEAMRVSPPPEILQAIEISQRRIPEIQKDIQSSKDRALRQLVHREEELAKIALDSPDLQKTVEGLPEIQQSSKEMRQQLSQLIDALPQIKEKERSRLYTEDPDLQDIKKNSQEMRRRVQKSPEMTTLRRDIKTQRQNLQKIEGEITYQIKQGLKQAKNIEGAQSATESAQKTSREIEEEQETVDRGDKIIKPKVERKKAPKK